MVTRCVSCHLLCFHVWRTRHVGLIEPHMSDGTVRSRSQAHTRVRAHTLYARPYAEKCREGGRGGERRGRAPQPRCLNSLQTAYDSSPSPFTCATGAASRLLLRQENRQKQQMHEMKFFKKLIWRRDKKKKRRGGRLAVSARFSRAGTLWNNSVHYACHYWLPNHTNQRPHCVDYLVNLLMPLSSIAGVNVPGFFPPPIFSY